MPTNTIAKDQELEKLKKQTSDVVERSERFQLDSDSALEKAAEVLRNAASRLEEYAKNGQGSQSSPKSTEESHEAYIKSCSYPVLADHFLFFPANFRTGLPYIRPTYF